MEISLGIYYHNHPKQHLKVQICLTDGAKLFIFGTFEV
ncbi:hypothetical protein D3OALGB2SA_3700 [Olavius algarvensis associated proteobacterium Delta 3]|nr:hypothetical protein D3OALGB2SA_3700 [Olavius algarvensis associated proteobacterium Delta 3]